TALFFSVEDVLFGSTPAAPEAEPPAVVWEYWNGTGWIRLETRDDTLGFTRRGLVTFVGPSDLAPSVEFGRTACWLRARWERGDFVGEPRLRRVLTNTTWVTNTTTIRGE